MEGKTLSGQFPVSGFQKLARLLDEEGDVFQNHVLDLVKDVVADADMHRGTMELLRQQLSEKDINDFLKLMPAAQGHYVRPGPVQELLALAEGAKDGHASQADIAQLIASELIHRKGWEKVLEAHPDTLTALKNKIS